MEPHRDGAHSHRNAGKEPSSLVDPSSRRRPPTGIIMKTVHAYLHKNFVLLIVTFSFSVQEEMLDPFALVKDEVSEISNKLRSVAVSEVHALNCTPILNYTCALSA